MRQYIFTQSLPITFAYKLRRKYMNEVRLHPIVQVAGRVGILLNFYVLTLEIIPPESTADKQLFTNTKNILNWQKK